MSVGLDTKKAYQNCEKMQKLADTACMGEWNAFVAKGRTREIRLERLNNVPERFRAQVKDHVSTVFELKKSKKLNEEIEL